MRKRISINEPDVVNNQDITASKKSEMISGDLPGIRSFRDILAFEGRGDFINYLEWLGLDSDPNPVVLSALHHYFYDAEELKCVRTIVSLINLNQIKEIDKFLHSTFQALLPQSNLIGCFVDSKKHNIFVIQRTWSESELKRISTAVENGIMSRIPLLNRIYSLIDSRTNKYLTKRNVTMLFEEHGFKVMDMTDLDGLTYFHAKKVKTDKN